jgi:hypothetical protein
LEASYINDVSVLNWDKKSETDTYNILLSENDFEGYKLYRAPDPDFSECDWIYDSTGVKRYRMPIFQCDSLDWISGYSNIKNGMQKMHVPVFIFTGLKR